MIPTEFLTRLRHRLWSTSTFVLQVLPARNCRYYSRGKEVSGGTAQGYREKLYGLQCL